MKWQLAIRKEATSQITREAHLLRISSLSGRNFWKASNLVKSASYKSPRAKRRFWHHRHLIIHKQSSPTNLWRRRTAVWFLKRKRVNTVDVRTLKPSLPKKIWMKVRGSSAVEPQFKCLTKSEYLSCKVVKTARSSSTCSSKIRACLSWQNQKI